MSYTSGPGIRGKPAISRDISAQVRNTTTINAAFAAFISPMPGQ